MSQEARMQILMAAILGLCIACFVVISHEKERNGSDGDSPRFQSYMSTFGKYIPFMILAFWGIGVFTLGIEQTAQRLISIVFPFVVTISIYYMVLLCLMPMLRKRISARTCSMIWLLPAFLYVFINQIKLWVLPKVIFHVSRNAFLSIFLIWFAGFLGIMVWHIIQHLMFRRKILREAVSVTDEEILKLWKRELFRVQMTKHSYDLVVSKEITTPLTIGLFQSTTKVVLPERLYTSDELSLIFRHELVHIGREDAWSKFFVLFCIALSWFHPLMWTAMRKCKEDLELSCDETVLLEADEDTRKEYARLILNTSGCEKGFTTCLSASARAMQYRLRNIVKPRKLYSGAVFTGIVFFLLWVGMGKAGISFETETGAEFIYQSMDTDEFVIKEIEMCKPQSKTFTCIDPEAFHAYMQNITADNLLGDYLSEEGEFLYRIEYETKEGVMLINLRDHWIELISNYHESMEAYYISEGIDWEYLGTLLEEKAL